jgi:broad specificity phosphatase PhoE
VQQQFALKTGDHDTILDEQAGCQAEEMAVNLSSEIELPDVICVSPYLRTQETLRYMTRGWPQLANVPVVIEERIREQEHGSAILYNDWKVYVVFHPEQQILHDLQGPYWYRYEQGENVPDVRMRNWAFGDKMIRDYSGKNMLCVSHHLNILGERSNRERWDAAAFMKCDNEDKPINCGVTHYRFDPEAGSNGQGKLVLDFYNKCLYT